MDRNIQTRAIVLSVRKYGELHKAVTILSPDLGLVDAIIFGGRKGKKTALAPLFSFIPQAITEDLACTYTASFFCEIISKTPTDEPEQTFSLLSDALTALEADCGARKRITAAFIWKLMQISGTAPDLEYCPVCDRRYADDETLFFSNPMNTPCCKSCSDSEYIVLMPGSRRYLRYTMGMDFCTAASVVLNPAAEQRIYLYMLRWASVFAQTQLRTLNDLLTF